MVVRQFIIGAMLASLGFMGVASAQEDARRLSEEEIQKLFQESSEKYRKKREAQGGDSYEMDEDETVEVDENVDEVLHPDADESSHTESKHDVTILPKHAQEAEYNRPIEGYVPLADILMAIDVSNQTLQEVVDRVVVDAGKKTGAWKVKWRLRKENEFLLREKVNITAESTFGQFMDHLVDRVNNMTGVRLFVTTFDASRIIIISDTYY